MTVNKLVSGDVSREREESNRGIRGPDFRELSMESKTPSKYNRRAAVAKEQLHYRELPIREPIFYTELINGVGRQVYGVAI